jgi:hypothetical protein
MFDVRWLQVPLDELTEFWIQADSQLREAITSAANDIDIALSRNPESQGESRSGHRRILFIDPLGVSFRIDFKNSRVYVLHVWDIRRKRSR